MCKVTEDVPGSCERHRSRRHRSPKTIQVCARARALKKARVFVGRLATHATIELSPSSFDSPDGRLINFKSGNPGSVNSTGAYASPSFHTLPQGC